VLAVIDVVALLPAWPWQASLALLPAAALLAADRARSLGHAIAAGRLVTRSGERRRSRPDRRVLRRRRGGDER
jgi:putative membrane protein